MMSVVIELLILLLLCEAPAVTAGTVYQLVLLLVPPEVVQNED
jgi:hypothetical protein